MHKNTKYIVVENRKLTYGEASCFYHYSASRIGALVNEIGAKDTAKKLILRKAYVEAPCKVCGASCKTRTCSTKCHVKWAYKNKTGKYQTYKKAEFIPEPSKLHTRPEKCKTCGKYNNDKECPTDIYAPRAKYPDNCDVWAPIVPPTDNQIRGRQLSAANAGFGGENERRY